MPSPDILEAIDALGASDWSGEAYRHTRRGVPPLSGEGARIFGGRWNPRDSFPTIYLADSIAGCVAEFRRVAERQGLDPHSFLPRDLHVIEVSGLRVVDLSTADRLATIGLSFADVRSTDMEACQRIGEAASYLGYEGIAAPSATGTGLVIAVFEEHVGPDQLKLVRTEDLPLDIDG